MKFEQKWLEAASEKSFENVNRQIDGQTGDRQKAITIA